MKAERQSEEEERAAVEPQHTGKDVMNSRRQQHTSACTSHCPTNSIHAHVIAHARFCCSSLSYLYASCTGRTTDAHVASRVAMKDAHMMRDL